nr:hypothetical protein CFP56_50290 [Quercus suber]
MSDKVFSRLRPRFQIPDNVPIRKCDLGEKCYDGKSSDIGFYEAMFIAGLHLPLSTLHCQLAFYLGISIGFDQVHKGILYCQFVPSKGILDHRFVLGQDLEFDQDLGFDQEHEGILDRRFVLGQDLRFDQVHEGILNR